jgi:hypothetical protein
MEGLGMRNFINHVFKFIVVFLILDGCFYFNVSPATNPANISTAPANLGTAGTSVLSVKKIFTNVSGDQYVYLKYVTIADRFSRVYKFQLVLMPRKEDATNFSVELVDLKDAKGNPVERIIFGSRGRYMLANVKTPDNKYLIFYYPDNDIPSPLPAGVDLYIQALDKIPADMPKYTWLVFHNYLLDEYFFQPVLNEYWYLQRMQHKAINGRPMVDVLPFSGNPESTGRSFIFWKLED